MRKKCFFFLFLMISFGNSYHRKILSSVCKQLLIHFFGNYFRNIYHKNTFRCSGVSSSKVQPRIYSGLHKKCIVIPWKNILKIFFPEIWILFYRYKSCFFMEKTYPRIILFKPEQVLMKKSRNRFPRNTGEVLQ